MNDGTPKTVVIDAVREPDEHRDTERREHADPDREAVLLLRGDDVHDRRRERIHPPDGQVDLAADEQHHLARGDERDGRHRLGDVLEVVARVEGRASEREVDAEADRDDEDARLGAP